MPLTSISSLYNYSLFYLKKVNVPSILISFPTKKAKERRFFVIYLPYESLEKEEISVLHLDRSKILTPWMSLYPQSCGQTYLVLLT